MKTIIADDEPLVRYTLRDMLDEMKAPCEIVAEVASGRELIDRIAEDPPDLVFLDIKMPGIDGLAAMRLCIEEYSEILWVILTSHSEFSFAKEAIELGALHYLLKPVPPAELRAAVHRASDAYRASIADRDRNFQSLVERAVHGSVDPPHPSAALGSGITFLGLLVLDVAGNADTLARLQSEALRRLETRIAPLRRPQWRLAAVSLPDGNPLVVMSLLRGASSGATEVWRGELLRRITQVVRSIRSKSRFACLVWSVPHDSLNEFSSITAKLVDVSTFCVVSSDALCVSNRDLLNLKEQLGTDVADYCLLIRRLREAWRRGFLSSYLELVQELELLLGRVSPNSLAWLTEASWGYLSVTQPELDAEALRLGAAHRRRELLRALRAAADKLTVDRAIGAGGNEVINRIREYVSRHYMDDIGIAEIADCLNLTPNYVSTLFHKETGRTFVRYLTEVRINHARHLLDSPEATVAEVARAVGYRSARHFARLFRELVGRNPSEYHRIPAPKP